VPKLRPKISKTIEKYQKISKGIEGLKALKIHLLQGKLLILCAFALADASYTWQKSLANLILCLKNLLEQEKFLAYVSRL